MIGFFVCLYVARGKRLAFVPHNHIHLFLPPVIRFQFIIFFKKWPLLYKCNDSGGAASGPAGSSSWSGLSAAIDIDLLVA